MYQAILFVFAVAILGLLKTFLDKEEDQTKANNCHSIPSASDSTSKIVKLSLDQPAAKSDSLVQSKTIMMDSEVSIDELAPIAKVKPSIRVAPTAIIAAQAQVKPVQIRTEELNLDQNEQIMQDHTFGKLSKHFCFTRFIAINMSNSNLRTFFNKPSAR